MKVYFTDEAEADLEAIADYIASDNPARAISFVRELREKALALASLPLAFPLVPRYERQGVRRRIYGNYGIFYTVRGQLVVVIHILHGARDYDSIL